MPFKKGQPKPINSGRKKGRLNRKTVEIERLYDSVMGGGAYAKNLQARILAGKAPHMELYLNQMVHGKPTDKLEVVDETPTYKTLYLRPSADPLASSVEVALDADKLGEGSA